MIYLTTFKTAFLLFPLVAFLITIPFILIEYHKFGSINKLRTLIIYSFILYLMTIYFLVILPLPSREYVASLTTSKYQLIPFKFLYDFIKETPLVWNNPSTYLSAIKDASFYTVVFNIFMTIPFGMYLRYYFECDYKKTLKYSFLLSLFFELTQVTGLYFIYPRPYRLFDVDDLIMNTLGGLIGCFLMSKIKFLPTRSHIDRETKAAAKTVSGLRRITLFFLDLLIYIVFLGLFSVIAFTLKIDKKIEKLGVVLIFILYYSLIPYFRKGKTFGSSFVHVRFTFPNNSFLRLLLKAFCEHFYIFYLPSDFLYIISQFLNYWQLDILYKFIIIFISILILLKIYMGNFFKLLKSHKMFYDKISKVEFVSTIDE